MNEIENIESRVKECRRFLEEYLEKSEEKQINYTSTGFDKLFEDNRTYINKQIEFILQIIDLKIVEENKFSRQMKAFVNECIGRMEQEFKVCYNEHLIYEIIHRLFQHKRHSIFR